eukprot:m.35956 g.35956  ORF g.35956 m.35956 type:complete len:781 (-) comp5753_c0_seq1:2045-4387(-)
MAVRAMTSLFKSLTRRRHCCDSGAMMHLHGADQIIFAQLPPQGDTRTEQDLFFCKSARLAEELRKHHEEHFMVHVVADLEVDETLFLGNVVRMSAPSNFRPPSLAPSLDAVLSLCRTVSSWVELDESNIAVILAPAAQMPILAACLQAFCGLDPPTTSNSHAWYIQKCRELELISSECPPIKAHSFFLAQFLAQALPELGIGTDDNSDDSGNPGDGQASSPEKRSRKASKSSKASSKQSSKSSLFSSASRMSPPASASASPAASPSRASLGAGGSASEALPLNKLESVVLKGPPRNAKASAWRPFIMLIQGERILFSGMSIPGGPKRFDPDTACITLPVGIKAHGDLILRIYDLPEGKSGMQLLSVAFNTVFVRRTKPDRGIFRIHGGDIDQVVDAPHLFGENFFLEFHFGSTGPDTHSGSGSDESDGEAAAVAAAAPAALGAADSSQQQQQQQPPSPGLIRPVPRMLTLQPLGGDMGPDESSTDDVILPPLRGSLPPPPPPPPPAVAAGLSPAERELQQQIEADEAFARALQGQLEEDEAFARELQRQFDAEVAAAEEQRRAEEQQHDHPRLATQRRAMALAEALSEEERRHRANAADALDRPLQRPSRPRLRRAPLPLPSLSLSDSEEDIYESPGMPFPPILVRPPPPPAPPELPAPDLPSEEGRQRTQRRRLRRPRHADLSSSPSVGLLQMLEQLHVGTVRSVSRRNISELPVSPVQAGSRLLGEDCLVCCGQFEVEELFKTLPCLHMFHAECIDPWLIQKPTCPVCLTRIDVDLMP